MHLTFLSYGTVEELEQFEKWWSTRTVMLPFEKDGVKGKQAHQVSLRKLQPYDLIFPKEYLPHVLNTMPNLQTSWDTWNVKGTIFNRLIQGLRKLIKLKPIPKNWNKSSNVGFPFPTGMNLRNFAVGIREDREYTDIQDGHKVTREGL